MFIFRHQELLQFEGGLEFLLRQNFERIVMCPLNPLKVCTISAKQYNVCYYYCSFQMCLNSVAELFASVTKCVNIFMLMSMLTALLHIV